MYSLCAFLCVCVSLRAYHPLFGADRVCQRPRIILRVSKHSLNNAGLFFTKESSSLGGNSLPKVHPNFCRSWEEELLGIHVLASNLAWLSAARPKKLVEFAQESLPKVKQRVHPPCEPQEILRGSNHQSETAKTRKHLVDCSVATT